MPPSYRPLKDTCNMRLPCRNLPVVPTPGLEDLCLAGPWGAPHAYQSWSSILRAMRSEAVLSNDEARCFINLGDLWPKVYSGFALNSGPNPVLCSGDQLQRLVAPGVRGCHSRVHHWPPGKPPEPKDAPLVSEGERRGPGRAFPQFCVAAALKNSNDFDGRTSVGRSGVSL